MRVPTRSCFLAVLTLALFCGLAAQSANSKRLTNADVASLTKAGIAPSVIVLTIQHSATDFDTSAQALESLKAAGVDQSVMAAMITAGTLHGDDAAPSGAALVTPTLASATPDATGVLDLSDSTPVKLKLMENLSSADATTGEQVPFQVVEDVVVGGRVVIPKDSNAIGTVTLAQHKGHFGHGGKLNVNIDSVTLVDGEKIQLRAVKDTQGGGHTGAMTGAMVATGILFFPAAPLFLFMHGKDITIPEGTQITAFVNGDTKVPASKFPPAL